jgi:hypothetical protein
MSAPPVLPDWRDDQTYAPLLSCGRAAFAWEWLRRSPTYRTAEPYDAAFLERFGLHRWEDPARSIPDAHPIWRASVDPCVLTANACVVAEGEAGFDLTHLAVPSDCWHRNNDIEHWLLGEGARTIRLDVAGKSLRDGPVTLQFRVAPLARLAAQARTLLAFHALATKEKLPPSLFPAERRVGRWTLTLRVHDALQAGASQREMAQCLFGLDDAPRWRISAPSYRRRVQRLVEAARWQAARNPVHWLQRDFP